MSKTTNEHIVICGVADPWHLGTDTDQRLWLMDPDPAIFVTDLQDAKKNFYLIFSAYFFLNQIRTSWLVDPDPDPWGHKTLVICAC